MINPIRHYIKIGVPLQAETRAKKILTSLQMSVTILAKQTLIMEIRTVSYLPLTHRSIRETESRNIRLSIGIISIIIIASCDGGLMETK